MPSDVRAGQQFHDLVQCYYEFESSFISERTLIKASGRDGRTDLLLFVEGENLVLAEVKYTDWDRLAARGTQERNLASHRRQLWQYLDGVVEEVKLADGGSLRLRLQRYERQGALIYPQRPASAGLDVAIEEELGTWGITVIWFFEPPPADSPAHPAWIAMCEGRLPPRRRRSNTVRRHAATRGHGAQRKSDW